MIRYESERDELQLNMAPMIDMVFLLIIFFLTATTFTEREREQDVLLPTNRNPGSLSRSFDNNLIVNVKHDGTIWVQGALSSAEDLAGIVAAKRRAVGAELKVQVRGDGRAQWHDVARAFEGIEAGGVQKSYIDTKYVGPAD